MSADAKALVVSGAQAASVLKEYTEEQIGILRAHVAPNFSEAELAYGLTVAKARGLDPFAKQVYFTKRRQWDRDSNGYLERVTVEPTIDGFRVIAARTGEMDGCEDPLWCGADGVWRDVWLEKDPPSAAKVTVYRRNHRKHYSAVARFDEYAQRKKDNSLTQMWLKMPGAMLAKCAEALALRRAFPEALGGLYSHEEMMQADTEARDMLPPERERGSNVVNMPPPKVEPTRISAPATVEAKLEAARAVVAESTVEHRAERKGEGLPDKWTPAEAIPVAIRLWLTPLAELEKPLPEMEVADLELVVEQCATAYERAKANPKTTKKLLALLNAIGAGASAIHFQKTNTGGAA